MNCLDLKGNKIEKYTLPVWLYYYDEQTDQIEKIKLCT